MSEGPQDIKLLKMFMSLSLLSVDENTRFDCGTRQKERNAALIAYHYVSTQESYAADMRDDFDFYSTFPGIIEASLAGDSAEVGRLMMKAIEKNKRERVKYIFLCWTGLQLTDRELTDYLKEYEES